MNLTEAIRIIIKASGGFRAVRGRLSVECRDRENKTALWCKEDGKQGYYSPSLDDIVADDWKVKRETVYFARALEQTRSGANMVRESTGKRLALDAEFTIEDFEAVDWCVADPVIDTIDKERAKE